MSDIRQDKLLDSPIKECLGKFFMTVTGSIFNLHHLCFPRTMQNATCKGLEGLLFANYHSHNDVVNDVVLEKDRHKVLSLIFKIHYGFEEDWVNPVESL